MIYLSEHQTIAFQCPIAQRANDVKVTNLQFLPEFCHFSHFNDKSQTKVRNSLIVELFVCLSFGSINSNSAQRYSQCPKQPLLNHTGSLYTRA